MLIDTLSRRGRRNICIKGALWAFLSAGTNCGDVSCSMAESSNLLRGECGEVADAGWLGRNLRMKLPQASTFREVFPRRAHRRLIHYELQHKFRHLGRTLAHVAPLEPWLVRLKPRVSASKDSSSSLFLL